MPLYVTEATGTPDTPAGDTPGRLLEGDRYAVLGGLTFGAVNDAGVRVYLAGTKGWYDGPASTGEVTQRDNDHGGWPGPAFMAPRVIELLLRLRGSSWSHLNATIEDIIGAAPLQGLDQLSMHDNGTTRVAWVRQEGEPVVVRGGAGAEVSLSLIAPDPRKYGADVETASTGLPQTTGGIVLPRSLPYTIDATVSSGVLVTNNAGTAATRPTLKLYGPTPADTRITHRGSGRTLRIPDAVDAGRVLVLDVDNRRALLDGTALRRVTGAWFDYAPGDNEVALSAPSYDPDALLVSEHRSAWR